MKKYQHYIDVRGEVLLSPCGTMTAVATSVFEPRLELFINVVCATSIASNQPDHTGSLI